MDFELRYPLLSGANDNVRAISVPTHFFKLVLLKKQKIMLSESDASSAFYI